MSTFTQAEFNRIYREAARALREMHRDEYRRLVVAIKTREEGRKVAAGNIQSPLVAVARDPKPAARPRKPSKPKRRPGRPRCGAWADIDRIRELHAEHVPVGAQAEILGVDRRTIERIRAAEGLVYAPGNRADWPAEPLLSLIAHRSLSYESERAMLLSVAAEWRISFGALDRAVKRAKASGQVTERTAERLALYLGRRVEDLWEETSWQTTTGVA